MGIGAFLFILLFSLLSFTPNNKKEEKPTLTTLITPVTNSGEEIYNILGANNSELPKKEIFLKAFEGYSLFKEKGVIKKDYLTVIDFGLSSSIKRLWIIDMDQNKVVVNSLVAHGKNSGEEYATAFSNKNESHKSSLGFYLTGEAYHGKHGLSLKLDGLENGINDNARERAIVIHGANYVSETFVKNHNRLGRSHGCPAVPTELTDEIIQTIKGESCLFIYHPSRENPEITKQLS